VKRRRRAADDGGDAAGHRRVGQQVTNAVGHRSRVVGARVRERPSRCVGWGGRDDIRRGRPRTSRSPHAWRPQPRPRTTGRRPLRRVALAF
jgi:hypothetical protein